jgi:carbamoyltransferase
LGKDYAPEHVSPYTGPIYSEQRVADAICAHETVATGTEAILQAAGMLHAGKVLALFQGRSEMGPRALGNRSILMTPFTAEARDHLNNVVKRREPFRPFAPVVPEGEVARYFECADPSPFMLYTTQVKQAYRQRLAAVTHVDGSARLQTVSPRQNALLHSLLLEFGSLAGTPILLNTSFNVAGEPLVETPEDAIRCFERNRIDALLIEGVLLVKRGPM